MIYTLSKEYTFEGTAYTEVEIPIDDMSGAQLKKIKKGYLKLAKLSRFEQTPVVIMWDEDFCFYLASELTKLPIEFFEGLPVGDYVGLLSEIQSFLSPSDSTSSGASTKTSETSSAESSSSPASLPAPSSTSSTNP